MASADRSPVCMRVRNGVQARCTYRSPPAARAGVSSACTASASFSSPATRSMKPLDSISRAAFARTPATQPAETAIPAISRISSAARPTGMKFPQARFAACACASGPKLARARTCAGSTPSVTSPQHGHAFDCATCSVTSGSGAGLMSVTWWRRCAQTCSRARPVPHSRHSDGGYQNRYSGLSTSFIVVPGSPGCLPGRRFPRSRSDRSFFSYGLSDDGGFDDVEESFPARRSSCPIRSRICPITAACSAMTRHASASWAASSPCGRAASSPADGRPGTPGTSGTAGNHRDPGTPVNHPRRRVA